VMCQMRIPQIFSFAQYLAILLLLEKGVLCQLLEQFGQDHRRSENVFIITSGSKTWKDIAIVFWHTTDLPLNCLEEVGPQCSYSS
jgi:hypothetical protein